MEQIYIIIAMLCIYVITVISLVAMLSKKDKQFAEERKDLLNRLMAKNTQEYIQVSKKETKKQTLTDGEILGDDRYNGILN
jgi:choline-glycine betaine transporter